MKTVWIVLHGEKNKGGYIQNVKHVCATKEVGEKMYLKMCYILRDRWQSRRNYNQEEYQGKYETITLYDGSVAERMEVGSDYALLYEVKVINEVIND